MSKLQGLKDLKAKFDVNTKVMAHTMLYKNLPLEKHYLHLVGLAKSMLRYQEAADLYWQLGLLRNECIQGLSGLEPEDYDPYYNGDGNPPLDEPRKYDPYVEMGWLLAEDYTPFGLGLDMSQEMLSAVGFMLQLAENAVMKEPVGLLYRDSDEGELRPMTLAESVRINRKSQTELMAETAFTQTYNDEMAQIRHLVSQRGSLTEILDLIGPEPDKEEAI
jgi:hypothetical protein